MKRRCIIIISLLFTILCAANDTVLPNGWRYPTDAELSDEPLRDESPTKYTKAVADFNGDGINDEAFLLKSTTFSGEGLFVRLSDSSSQFKWLNLDTTDWGDKFPNVNLAMGLDIAKPGKYLTVYGKGYFEANNSEPKTIELKLPSINYFKFQSANSYFYWDVNTKNFKRIWISD